MKKSNSVIAFVAIIIWAFLPRGLALAQVPALSFPYVSCSTGAAPFTPATVAANTAQEVQAFCNAGDSATGGGYEVLSQLPPPPGTLVIVPENSFHQTTPSSGPLSGITYPDGWQVVLQNVNLDSRCLYRWSSSKSCPSVQFRVCVGCVTTLFPTAP
jgi:hypothetical protein